MHIAKNLGLPLALLISFVVGCSPAQPTGDRETTVSAGGELTYQGQPLPYHQVLLTPESSKRPAAGVTDESGKFVLGTNQPGDGAVAGKHQVSVVYVGPPGSGGDGINDFTPPPPPKVKIPAKYQRAETSGVSVEIPDGGDQALKINLP
jgi:hypothetical protein